MAGHSRPKDGVLSHAYVAGIHVLDCAAKSKGVDGRDKPGHDGFIWRSRSRGWSSGYALNFHVMPGFMPGIHVFTAQQKAKAWMAGTSPAMTSN